MMAKIVHTAKQTVNAIVESQSARFWSPEDGIVGVTVRPSQSFHDRGGSVAHSRARRLDTDQIELRKLDFQVRFPAMSGVLQRRLKSLSVGTQI
jgi:hypothetical protein